MPNAAERSYVNFDLRVEKTGPVGGYCAVATSADSGEGHHEFELALAEGEWRLPEGPTDEERDRVPGAPTVSERARRIGERLFRAVFGGSVLPCFELERRRVRALGQGLRLRLRFNRVPELAALPWELFFDPFRSHDYLVLDPDLSLVRYLESPDPPEPLAVQGPLHILVAVAGSRNHPVLKAEEEYKKIEEALGESKRAKRILLDRLPQATRRSLKERLRSPTWHVLHFIGHGTGGEETASGALELVDEGGLFQLIEAEDLARLLASQPNLRLVVLNACEGGLASPQDVLAGVAQRLAHRGLAAVVAMQSTISDRASISFAEHFYEELARGASVDQAMVEARRSMFLLDPDEFRVDWAAPVLMMRSSDGRLFAIEDVNEASALPAVEGGEDGTAVKDDVESVWSGAGLKILAAVGGLVVAGWLAVSQWPAIYHLLKSSSGQGSRSVMSTMTPRKGPPRRPTPIDPAECPPPRGLDLHFVLIKPKPFQMGSDTGPAEIRPSHEVRLTHPYCLGITEVTQAQWQAIMGEGSEKSLVRGDDFPVTGVNWYQAEQFGQNLSVGEPGPPFRLPTEAESEYAARAGAAAGTIPAEPTIQAPRTAPPSRGRA